MSPEEFTTLIEMLAWRAEVSAGRVAFTFNGTPYTFGELWRGINRFAEYLQRLSIQRQECVLIVLPNSAEFFFAFYGIQRAGGIAVPIFPHSGRERILAIAEACDAHTIVVPTNIAVEEIRQIKEAGISRRMNVVTVGDSDGMLVESDFPTIHSDDVAFLQYTSGS